MSAVNITDPSQVELALHTDALVPPPAPGTLGHGATARLRDAMARFSGGDDHRPRRDEVVAAVERLDPSVMAARARVLTERLLGSREGGARPDLGFVVPTHCMAAALAVPESEWEAVRTDVAAVVAAIGRSEAASEMTDRATARLMQRFAGHPDGPVAAISLLYQNHDATAALLAAVSEAATTGDERRSALAKTVRVAAEPITIGDTTVEAGTSVVISLEARTNEFGVGSHECPGRSVAEAIVAGIVAAMANHGSEDS